MATPPDSDPSSDSPRTVKLYFCGSCGKRLSEHDVKAGAARDKKLKGVYCKECAIAVTTMETLPMSNQEAERLVKEEPPARPEAEPYLAQRAASRSSRRSASLPQQGPGNARMIVSVLAGVGLFAVGIGLFLSFSGTSEKESRPGKSTKSSKKNASSGKPQPEPAPSGSADPLPLPKNVTTASETDTTAPTPPPSEVTKKTAPAPPTVLVPANIVARLKNKDRIEVTWQGKWRESSSLEVECRETAIAAGGSSQDKVPWKKVATVASGESRFEDAEVRAGFKYSYRMRAVEGERQSAYSALAECEVPEDPLEKAVAAYADFEKAFVPLLRNRERRDAEELVRKAEADARLKPLKSHVAIARKAVGWLDELEASVVRGAERLKKMDKFELVMAGGRKMSVGRKGDFQVTGVTGKGLQVSSKGMTMPIALDRLDASTRRRLAEMGLNDDLNSLRLRAFREILTLSEGKGELTADTPRATLKRAAAAGLGDPERQFLERLLDRAIKEAEERAAMTAWEEIDGLASKKEWKPLLEAVSRYHKRYGSTPMGSRKQKALAAFRIQAEEEIIKAEGIHFNFDTPESYQRFKKLFSYEKTRSIKIEHRKGRVVFSRVTSDDTNVVLMRAPKLILGDHWDFRCRFHIHSGPTRKEQYATFDLFLPTTNKGSKWYREGAFHPLGFRIDTRLDGLLSFGLHARLPRGDDKNALGRGNVFSGIADTGFVGELWRDPKAKELADKEGRYRLHFSMRGKRFVLKSNGKSMMNAELPQAAYEFIRTSPLAFRIRIRYETREFDLEDLVFRSQSK